MRKLIIMFLITNGCLITSTVASTVVGQLIPADPTGKTISSATLLQLKSFKIEGNKYVAQTSIPISLVNQKYILPVGSSINGVCDGVGSFGSIIKINGNAIINDDGPVKYNQGFMSKEGLNTTCFGVAGDLPNEIILSSGLKLSKNSRLIKTPKFTKNLEFETKNELFDINKIETNGYQMKITFNGKPKEFPLIGLLNSNMNSIISLNQNQDLQSKKFAIIIDGVHDQFAVAVDEKNREVITIKK